MRREFTAPVTWEFNCRLQGDGVDCRSALLAALANKYRDVDKASPYILGAIEKNETWMIAGEIVQPDTGFKLKYFGAFFLFLAFMAASMLFIYRYMEFSSACAHSGRSAEECERILR